MNTWIIFKTALRLGVTSFGGPTAHLGYFHETYVRRKSGSQTVNTQISSHSLNFYPGLRAVKSVSASGI